MSKRVWFSKPSEDEKLWIEDQTNELKKIKIDGDNIYITFSSTVNEVETIHECVCSKSINSLINGVVYFTSYIENKSLIYDSIVDVLSNKQGCKPIILYICYGSVYFRMNKSETEQLNSTFNFVNPI